MKHIIKKFFPAIILLSLFPLLAYASEGEQNMIHKMMILVFQLCIIIFAAKYFGKLFERLKLPAVIGELFAGIIIGPYLLGGLSLPGFPHGVFGEFLAINPGATLPVSPELYAFSVIASILLLFLVGLETDINLFLRFAFPSIVIGGFGVAASFISGAYIASWMMGIPFMHPQALFLGVISTATSVGITAKILSNRKKINSPEGVTILGSAVIDDVLGIIMLAIVIGLSASKNAAMDWGNIARISIKALAVWLAFTILGLIFAKFISKYLKTFKTQSSVGIMSFGLALLLAGIFESAGLAMIIGAYVMGLSLSKTELSYVIQESLHNISELLVPIFFCISGMFVNFRVFDNWNIVIFGLIYTVSAYLAKVIGSGLPAKFFKFNGHGAMRIGVGMVPRGEVALIIIGIGMSYGILTDELAGVSILMIFITSLMAPVHLDKLLKNKKSGVQKGVVVDENIQTDYPFPSEEMTDLVATKLVRYFREEGFFINLIEGEQHIYHVRRQNTFFSFSFAKKNISFSTQVDDVDYIKNIMYETLLDLQQTIDKLKVHADPDTMKQELQSKQIKSGKEMKMRLPLDDLLSEDCIILNLKADSKEALIESMINVLDEKNLLVDKDEALEAILEREKTMSTGMQHGVALPHGKTDAVKRMCMAVGLMPQGMDFQSLDGKLSRVFILIASRKHAAEPHIQLLSEVSKKLYSEESVMALLKCKTKKEVRNFFIK